MKNIAKIMCGISMGVIMGITCVACTNDKNVNVEETTTATESTEVETDTTEMTEDTTEETDETETETVDETETVEETETTQETVVDETTNVVATTVAKKNAPKNNNTIVKTTTADEDRDMGSQDKEETYVEEVNDENATASADVSNSDYVLLCNAVAYEAGSNWITTADKAKVAEVILNRVNSGSYPDTVYGVITQKGQFSGCWNYANLNDFSGKVTEDVKAAVDMALSSDYDNHGYTGFYGDGRQNHFK